MANGITRYCPQLEVVQLILGQLLSPLERLSAFHRGPDGRLMGADDRFGSGGDCDLVKNITTLNGRY